jgi:hypothetical protein
MQSAGRQQPQIFPCRMLAFLSLLIARRAGSYGMNDDSFLVDRPQGGLLRNE